MEFRILGPLEVEDDGRAIVLGGPKQRALLALLLLTPNRPVSVDPLTDALWAAEPPRRGDERASVPRLAAAKAARRRWPDRHPGAGIPDSGWRRRARPVSVRAAGLP